MTSKYEELEELFEEAVATLENTLEENRKLKEEEAYFSDFLEWKSLTKEYEHFKENAVLDPNEELFPRYILPIEK